MLNLFGSGATFCDGITRRTVLKAGACALGGLTLADLLRLRATAGERSRKTTSIIFLELAGGPSHFETYDPKPQAPSEIRGPLSTIATRLPGVRFSECMTQQAKIANRLTVLRSIHHPNNSHDPSSHLTQTGYYKAGMKGGVNEMPCIGSVVARFRGPNREALPAYVAIPKVMRNGGAAALGRAYQSFETIADPNRPNYEIRNLALLDDLTADRLSDRRALLTSLDMHRRLGDLDGSSQAIDKFTREALELVTGPRARQAFDISREKDGIRDRYGRSTVGQSMLLARRLVEAGVTCVTVRVPGWDNHVKIANFIKKGGAQYDQGIAALVRDLYDRGLDKDVLVVAMGEFGRTPKVNKNAGRDHWGAAMSVVLAGGGLKPGVVGESNRKGEVPHSLPYRPEHVLATAYRHLGIDPEQTFNDFSGRPRYLLEERKVIREIV